MAMKRVSTTELRANLARFIKEANETGECLLITEYNLPAAMLCPRPQITEHVTSSDEPPSRTRA
jgi:prevent-host-death family protein